MYLGNFFIFYSFNFTFANSSSTDDFPKASPRARDIPLLAVSITVYLRKLWGILESSFSWSEFQVVLYLISVLYDMARRRSTIYRPQQPVYAFLRSRLLYFATALFPGFSSEREIICCRLCTARGTGNLFTLEYPVICPKATLFCASRYKRTARFPAESRLV